MRLTCVKKLFRTICTSIDKLIISARKRRRNWDVYFCPSYLQWGGEGDDFSPGAGGGILQHFSQESEDSNIHIIQSHIPCFYSVLWIRIQHFNLIRIRIRHRTQGFDDQKFKKFTGGKIFFIFFIKKLQLTYPYASLKYVQATGEAFSPQNITSSA